MTAKTCGACDCQRPLVSSAQRTAARRPEFNGARIFFPEERWQASNAELRDHWTR
jgi:hypothetical protein